MVQGFSILFFLTSFLPLLVSITHIPFSYPAFIFVYNKFY